MIKFLDLKQINDRFNTEFITKFKEILESGWYILGKPVSYTHLRAHETVLDLVCRLLLEKK
ncbi:hypothetical protein Y869_04345, partial [Campylobacter jejuni CVM 41921]